MILRLLIVAAAGAAIVAPSAAAPERTLPIRVGVGIGPVSLGMTPEQVRRGLGSPRAVVERRVVRGQPYVELEYALGSWAVGYLGRRGSRRVVLVATGLSRHRTPEGLGPGVREDVFWRRARRLGYRRRTCERGIVRTTHWVLARGNVETVFFPGGPFGQQEVMNAEVRRSPAVGCSF